MIEDGEKLLVSKDNVIGCRGILGEKILLDSILQYDCKEKSTWKIELDLVQVALILFCIISLLINLLLNNLRESLMNLLQKLNAVWVP